MVFSLGTEMVNLYKRFNEWLAVKVTNAVGTMTCAYLFSILALTGLPGAIRDSMTQRSLLPVDMWLSQNYIQLVLLPVIIVGQAIQQRRMDDLHAKHEQHGAALEALHGKQDVLIEQMKG